MDLEGIKLTQIEKDMSDRERQILYDLTYIWNLSKKKIKFIGTKNSLY